MSKDCLSSAMLAVSYDREYCCSKCGLIWFAKTNLGSNVTCIECNNDGEYFPLFACDNSSYLYAYDSIKSSLDEVGKIIHYHESHPSYRK